jgi:hypothetical protein
MKAIVDALWMGDFMEDSDKHSDSDIGDMSAATVVHLKLGKTPTFLKWTLTFRFQRPGRVFVTCRKCL